MTQDLYEGVQACLLLGGPLLAVLYMINLERFFQRAVPALAGHTACLVSEPL